MIYGIGNDIVEISRISELLKKFGQKFKDRIFTEQEQIIGKDNVYYYAKRFAAKESVAKAFGTGIGAFVTFLDIEILNDKGGKPYVKFSHEFQKIVDKMFSDHRIYLSIADEKSYATAFAVIEIID